MINIITGTDLRMFISYFPDFNSCVWVFVFDQVLEDKANEICGDDLFCKFDIAATGRV